MARSVVITGSRTGGAGFRQRLFEVLREVPDDFLIIQGGALGVDQAAAGACRKLQRPYMEVPARWDRFGKGAGPIRNKAMVALGPEMVLAFSEFPITVGTESTMLHALDAGIPVKYYTRTHGPFVFRTLADLRSFQGGTGNPMMNLDKPATP